MDVLFGAILHVNRSGSTFLSRLMGDSSRDVFVFPETSFLVDLLISIDRGTFLSGQSLFDVVSSDRRRDGLGLDDAILKVLCDRNTSADLERLIVDIATTISGRRPKIIILKLGILLYFVFQLQKALSSLRLIHIVRDPRSVCNSMLHSDLPEKPGFNMARGSVVFAAKEWRNYINLVRSVELEIPVTWVRYDDLRHDPREACTTILAGFGVTAPAPVDRRDRRRYRISSLDNELHSLVFDEFDSRRIEAWKTELPDKSVRIIETLCGRDMEALGYARSSGNISAFEMLLALARHFVSLSHHNIRTLRVYARRRDGFVSLRKRLQLGWEMIRQYYIMSDRAWRLRGEKRDDPNGVGRERTQTV